MAEVRGITVSYEFHGNTLTDTNESAVALLDAVDHPNVYTYWQPAGGKPFAYQLQGLDAVRPRLTNLHVHYIPTVGKERRRAPLAEGKEAWLAFLAKAVSEGREHYALIEFVCDGTPRQFMEDAETLKAWLLALRQA